LGPQHVLMAFFAFPGRPLARRYLQQVCLCRCDVVMFGIALVVMSHLLRRIRGGALRLV